MDKISSSIHKLDLHSLYGIYINIAYVCVQIDMRFLRPIEYIQSSVN